MIHLPFRDRTDAGRLLGAELATRAATKNPIVLALPRGGVVIGAEVAEALRAPLDVVVVRKLGVPWQPELAMGAIAGRTCALDNALITELGISRAELEAVIAREKQEIERRETLYRDALPPPKLSDRIVFLVDDGLATGSTMIAAARHVRAFHPRRLVIAVPVGSNQACERLATEADECICLRRPEPFSSVGEWYDDFRQVTDAEVREILKRTHIGVPVG